MNMKKKYLILLFALIARGIGVHGQDTSNCFLYDFTPREAVIPLYEDYERITAVPTVNITINYADTVSMISKYVFGNAVAVWVSPDVNNPTLVGYLKKLAPTLIRFPGGSWSDIYFWNGNPGDLPSTVPNSDGVLSSLNPQFGPNQKPTFSSYLDMRNKIGTQGLITVNYAYARYGLSAKPAEQAAHYAANWVRNDNGRTKFWEIGNESAGTWEAGWRINPATNQDGQPEIIDGHTYSEHFKIFADSMKKAAAEVGAEIYIGAQIIQYDGTNSWNVADRHWNEAVLGEVSDTADFYVIHNYFGGTAGDPKSYFNTALTSINDMHDFIQQDIEDKNAAKRPVALTEWNTSAEDNVKTSVINGMQGVLAMSEMAKLGYGMSCRWLVANWEGDGMFYHSNISGIPEWNPRPDFYYLYYLQHYFGSYFLSSEVTGSADIKAYTTLFNSGQVGIILVNMGTTDQAVGLNLENSGYGNRYYYYSLRGGTDDGYYSKYVYVNDSGPEPTRWGPLANLENLKARSDTLIYPVKIRSPKLSVQYILLEAGDSLLKQVDVDSLKVSTENGDTSISEDNGTIQFMGHIFPGNATDNGIIWSTSDSSVAVIDQFGLLKAVYNGTVTITGTASEGGFTDEIVVTISNQRYELTGLSLTTETGSRTIRTPGGILQIVAVIVPANAEDTSVTWSVNDTSLASVSPEGLLSAKQNGQVTVTCVTHDGGYTEDIVITIIGQLTGISDFSLVALKVYPVPARNSIYIENESQVQTYEILSIEGKVIKTINHPDLIVEVDIGDFERGIYIIRARTETGLRMVRFIK
jgi:hypothetical protein